MPAAYSVPQAPVDDTSVDSVDRKIALVSHIICMRGNALGGRYSQSLQRNPRREPEYRFLESLAGS